MNLSFTELRATYRVIFPFHLPVHSGSLLRGVIGRALRNAACLAPAPCFTACRHPAACAYTRLFDPPLPVSAPHSFFRGAPRAPQPLIPLFPPARRVELTPGAPFSFGLRVLGPLEPTDIDHLSTALEQLSTFPLGPDQGRLVLEGIEQRAPHRRSIDVRPADPRQGRLQIRTETPLWIERKGKLLAPQDVDFPTLFRHAYRRLTALVALYGTPEPDDDRAFTELAAIAPEVRIVEQKLLAFRWERWSKEKDIHHPMKGLMGTLVFEGPVGAFVPVLRAAELVHFGKGTSYGLGRLEVTVDERS